MDVKHNNLLEILDELEELYENDKDTLSGYRLVKPNLKQLYHVVRPTGVTTLSSRTPSEEDVSYLYY